MLDVMEAVQARYSARSFRPAAVPRENVERMLEAARWAPSWANTQPWEFYVASGAVWQRIKEEWLALYDQGVEIHPDLPVPGSWPEELNRRAAETGALLYGSLGLDRQDAEGRRRFRRLGLEAFGAPLAIFLVQPAGLTAWSVLDLGIALGQMMLAATAEGLATCPEATLAYYPDVLRRHLNMPADRQIICGLAVGYADPAAPANLKERRRVPLRDLVRWLGD